MEGKNTYEDAVNLLNSLQLSFAILEERRRIGHKMDSSAVREMKEWVRRIGYAPSDFNRLNVVHVAGTKGKGSTCAYVNSILSSYRTTIGLPKKLGLYTSPHLISVRERIRINSEPISEPLFARYFFEVWNALERSASEEGLDPTYKPGYFRFLTLMSFHVFMREAVDVAIYEVGVGGEWDSTNIIEEPIATGITTLEIDHIPVLGDTIEKIAWHKTGIFKPGCPAYSVVQLPVALLVLEQRAREKDVQLETVTIHPALKDVNIIPDEDFQRSNATLAIALTGIVLEKWGISIMKDDSNLSQQCINGLEQVVWRGRCETKLDGDKTWYLDGAHTVESVKIAGQWFAKTAHKTPHSHVLIFNQQSYRDATPLLEALHRTLYASYNIQVEHVIFCPSVTHKVGYKLEFVNRNTDPQAVANLTLQRKFAVTWRKLDSVAKITVTGSIEEAVEHVNQLSKENGEIQILVTGNFHLVGGILSILEGEGLATN